MDESTKAELKRLALEMMRKKEQAAAFTGIALFLHGQSDSVNSDSAQKRSEGYDNEAEQAKADFLALLDKL